MTGTKRLRTLADAWGLWAHGEPLADVADQIERKCACDEDTIENVLLIVGGVIDDMERHLLGHEGADDSPVARWARELREALGGEEPDSTDDVSVSAYDLLPQEDRDAIAWVREHGGIAYVKEEWNARSNLKRSLETAQAKVERQQRHIEFVQGKCRERQGRIAALNKTVAEMRPRLMPEGMEWPAFEDCEPVRIGDVAVLADNEPHEVESMEFFADKSCKLKGKGTPWMNTIFKGQVAKRPAPKVLDADGVEIRVGDTVWTLKDARELEVTGLYPEQDSCPVKVKEHKNGAYIFSGVEPSDLTHRAPVIAADGRPLREGETVWFTTSGREMRIDKIEHRPEGFWALELFEDGSKRHSAPVSILAHERPDSWERLEEDANAAACVYFGASVKDCENCDHNPWECSYDKSRDLVRRAKALAGDA